LGRKTKATDSFELTAPGKGNDPVGRILVRSSRVIAVHRGCVLKVLFRVSTKLGPFDFSDPTDGGIWFGFNGRVLRAHNWKLTVIDKGSV
jgi:hypothetical protein